eukprot:TRINITY_DN1662_c2_g1_i1.p1 TRINITY_DN1662_c2_g1~~TRINITY_DN1662_c2_g1_i1.p1  ORF type:complete len:747 (+),score=255.34 TRINITY_DN1662_c2_g1_i1:71-2242(+)
MRRCCAGATHAVAGGSGGLGRAQQPRRPLQPAAPTAASPLLLPPRAPPPPLLPQRRSARAEVHKDRRLAATPRAQRVEPLLDWKGEEQGEVNWTRPKKRRRRLTKKDKQMLQLRRERLRMLKPPKEEELGKAVDRAEGAGETTEGPQGKPKEWFDRKEVQRKRQETPPWWLPSLALMPGDANPAGTPFPVLRVRSGRSLLFGRDPAVPRRWVVPTWSECGKLQLIPPGSLVSLPGEARPYRDVSMLAPGVTPPAPAELAPEGDGSQGLLPEEEAPESDAATEGGGAEEDSAGERGPAELPQWGEEANDLPHGSIVELRAHSPHDNSGRVIGWGVWQRAGTQAEPVPCRVFEWGPFRSKRGPLPPPAEPAGLAPGRFGDEYWLERVAAAYRLRAPLLTPGTDAYRLINDIGDGMPGIVCDVYAQVAVIIANDPPRAALRALAAFLGEIGVAHVMIRDRLGRFFLTPADPEHSPAAVEPPPGGWTRLRKHSHWLRGGVDSCQFSEAGVRYLWKPSLTSLSATGFPLVHRTARQTVGAVARDKTVLSLNCREGSMGIAALHGGARQVVFVDVASSKCDLVREQLDLRYAKGKEEWAAVCRVDCAEENTWLRAGDSKKRLYDVVVVDPRDAGVKVPRGEALTQTHWNWYREIYHNALRLVRRPGLMFVFATTHHLTLTDLSTLIVQAAARQHVTVSVLRSLAPSIDFPLDICSQQGTAYKGLMLEVR